MTRVPLSSYFFFFNDTATTEIYTLSLHDALPISQRARAGRAVRGDGARAVHHLRDDRDRKSTRLNSSHGYISYAVFCLKKKNKTWNTKPRVTHANHNTHYVDSSDARVESSYFASQ